MHDPWLIDVALITAWLHKKWYSSFAGSSICSNLWWLIRLFFACICRYVYVHNELWSMIHHSWLITHDSCAHVQVHIYARLGRGLIQRRRGNRKSCANSYYRAAFGSFGFFRASLNKRLKTHDSWLMILSLVTCISVLNTHESYHHVNEITHDSWLVLSPFVPLLLDASKWKNHARWVMHVYIFTYSFRHAYVLCCSVRPVLQCVGGVVWCSVM